MRGTRFAAAIVASTARAYGAEARLTYERNYPVTVNAAAQTDLAARVAAEVVGAPRVETEAAPLMGAEDFSFMLNARPGAMLFVGNGDTPKLRHPKYDFNDEMIPVGCSHWARLVKMAMPAEYSRGWLLSARHPTGQAGRPDAASLRS